MTYSPAAIFDRSGLKNLTIVDADRVAVSNINRQVPATTETVGVPKTEAMLRHLLTINPQANITAINDIYTASTAEKFDPEEYDYIIDAIDSLSDKAAAVFIDGRRAENGSHKNKDRRIPHRHRLQTRRRPAAPLQEERPLPCKKIQMRILR